MEDVLFIVNPRAASGRAARVWSALYQREARLRRAIVLQCSDAATAERAISAALTPRIRRVIAVGGDGTLHTVLNLLMRSGPEVPRCLGLIPVGTGSDLARGLKLETRPRRALERALDSTPAPLDVLHLSAHGGSRYFINEASLGITAMVAARVNALSRRSTATFLAAALRELAGFQPRWARIHLDGKPWREGRFYMTVVANGSHFGKGMCIAPLADPRDGLAEVVAVEAVSRARVLTWLPTIYLGKHLAAPFVHSARARTVEIETVDQTLFEGDGETGWSTPGTVSVLPGALSFCGLPAR